MATNNPTPDLAKFEIFHGLSEAGIAQVRQIIHEKNISANGLITREGDPGEEMYLLFSGSVEVSKSLTLMMSRNSLDTRDKSLMVLRAENTPCFGEMAMLNEDSRRSATVKAISECTVGVIHRRDFLALCESDVSLGFRLLFNIAKTLAVRLEKANQDILKLTTAFSLALKS